MNPTNNRYYTDDGDAMWNCLPHKDLSLTEINKLGFELNTDVGSYYHPPMKLFLGPNRCLVCSIIKSHAYMFIIVYKKEGLGR